MTEVESPMEQVRDLALKMSKQVGKLSESEKVQMASFISTFLPFELLAKVIKKPQQRASSKKRNRIGQRIAEIDGWLKQGLGSQIKEAIDSVEIPQRLEEIAAKCGRMPENTDEWQTLQVDAIIRKVKRDLLRIGYSIINGKVFRPSRRVRLVTTQQPVEDKE